MLRPAIAGVSPTPLVIGVVIVVETRLYRDGLARALNDDRRFRVLASAAAVPEAVSVIDEFPRPPDVVLLDHGVPDGVNAVRRLHDAAPGIPVLALAVHEVEADVIPWVEAGVAGFVPYDASLHHLLAGLEAVAEGGALYSPRLVAVLLNRLAFLADERRPPAPVAELTERQRQVALLLEEGLSNKEIAHRLKIQVTTVKNHVHNILEKLHVTRRGEAASAVRAERI